MSALPYAARRLAEITQRSPLPEVDGELSRSEQRFASEARAQSFEQMERDARASSLAVYHHALRRAEDVREVLLEKLAAHDPMSVEAVARTAKAIDAHSRAQSWLREAAQGVIDAHEYEDNGRAAGIVWEVPMHGGGR